VGSQRWNSQKSVLVKLCLCAERTAAQVMSSIALSLIEYLILKVQSEKNKLN